MEEDKTITLNERDIKKIELYVHNISLRVGELIRDFRKRRKLTIAELAKKSRVSSTVITDLENGRSLPRTEVLLKLAYALDLKYGQLFNEFMPGAEFVHAANTTRLPSLKDMIMCDGLGIIETNEVLEFIEFKKYRNSKRK